MTFNTAHKITPVLHDSTWVFHSHTTVLSLSQRRREMSYYAIISITAISYDDNNVTKDAVVQYD